MKQVAQEKNYQVIHGSGFFMPGKNREWKPFEKTVALVSPAGLFIRELTSLHKLAISYKFNFLNIAISHSDVEFEYETLEFLLSRRVWGIMLLPYPDSIQKNITILEKMKKSGINCVLLERPPGKTIEGNYSVFDFKKVGYMAAAQAMSANLKRVVHVRFNTQPWHIRHFYAGLEEGCLDLGLSLDTYDIPPSEVGAAPEFKWIPDLQFFSQQPPSVYVCDTYCGHAETLYSSLKTLNRAFYFIGYSSDISPKQEFPVICFDALSRLTETLRKVICAKNTPIHDIYPPKIIRP